MTGGAREGERRREERSGDEGNIWRKGVIGTEWMMNYGGFSGLLVSSGGLEFHQQCWGGRWGVYL